MRKFKLGFTLTEIMLALAIVGIVASVSTPMLVKNIQKNQSQLALAKAIENIELGNQHIIQFANDGVTNGSYFDVLSAITEKDINYSSQTTLILSNSDLFKKYWGLTETNFNPNKNGIEIKKFLDGENSSADLEKFPKEPTSEDFAKFKDFPAEVFVYIPDKFNNNSDVIAKTGLIIYIDTNGWTNKPNVAGKDIFAFEILNNGKLIPVEGTDAGDYAKKIVDNNFKITYY